MRVLLCVVLTFLTIASANALSGKYNPNYREIGALTLSGAPDRQHNSDCQKTYTGKLPDIKIRYNIIHNATYSGEATVNEGPHVTLYAEGVRNNGFYAFITDTSNLAPIDSIFLTIDLDRPFRMRSSFLQLYGGPTYQCYAKTASYQ